MNADQILRAMEHYGLTVFGPPRSGVDEGREWYARDAAGDHQGWGANPAEAIKNAVSIKERTTERCASQPGPNEWDFLD